MYNNTENKIGLFDIICFVALAFIVGVVFGYAWAWKAMEPYVVAL